MITDYKKLQILKSKPKISLKKSTADMDNDGVSDEEETQALVDADKPDFYNPRASKFSNLGEELKGSALHNRSQYANFSDGQGFISRSKLDKQSPMGYTVNDSYGAYLGLVKHAIYQGMPAKAGITSSHKPKGKYTDDDVIGHIWQADDEEGTFYGSVEHREPRSAKKVADVSYAEYKDVLNDEYINFRNKFSELADKHLPEGENFAHGMKKMRSEMVKYVNDRLEDGSSKRGYSLNHLALLHFRNFVNKGMSPYRNKKFAERLNKSLEEVKNRHESEFGNIPHEKLADAVSDMMSSHGDSFRQKAEDILRGVKVSKPKATQGEGEAGDKPKRAKTKAQIRKEFYQNQAERIGDDTVDDFSSDEKAERLTSHFDLRGVQYGNSVTDTEREFHLSQAHNALHDLTKALNLPPEMASFNGRLGLAIGARGRSAAMAHYEPSTHVINLTRKNGIGSLAHEWAHMFDHVLPMITHQTEKSNVMYGSENYGSSFRLSAYTPAHDDAGKISDAYKKARPAMEQYKNQVVDYFRKEYGRIPNKINYWVSDRELFARGFEKYLSQKLQKNAQRNTYLVPNELLSGIYPQGAVAEQLEGFFDELFSTFSESTFLKKSIADLFAAPKRRNLRKSLRKDFDWSKQRPQVIFGLILSEEITPSDLDRPQLERVVDHLIESDDIKYAKELLKRLDEPDTIFMVRIVTEAVRRLRTEDRQPWMAELGWHIAITYLSLAQLDAKCLLSNTIYPDDQHIKSSLLELMDIENLSDIPNDLNKETEFKFFAVLADDSKLQADLTYNDVDDYILTQMLKLCYPRKVLVDFCKNLLADSHSSTVRTQARNLLRYHGAYDESRYVDVWPNKTAYEELLEDVKKLGSGGQPVSERDLASIGHAKTASMFAKDGIVDPADVQWVVDHHNDTALRLPYEIEHSVDELNQEVTCRLHILLPNKIRDALIRAGKLESWNRSVPLAMAGVPNSIAFDTIKINQDGDNVSVEIGGNVKVAADATSEMYSSGYAGEMKLSGEMRSFFNMMLKQWASDAKIMTVQENIFGDRDIEETLIEAVRQIVRDSYNVKDVAIKSTKMHKSLAAGYPAAGSATTGMASMAKDKKRPKMNFEVGADEVLIYSDGDNAGSQVERAVNEGRLEAVYDIGVRIHKIGKILASFTKKNGGRIINKGGDDFTAIIPKKALYLLELPREKVRRQTGFTVTIGVGRTAAEAVHALIWGKAHGKDQVAVWDEDKERYVQEEIVRPTEEEKLRDTFSQ